MAESGHNYGRPIDPAHARRAVLLSEKPPLTKLIAIAIIEHMSANTMTAWPSKSRLMALCSAGAERTMRKHYRDALSFFEVNDRPGRTPTLCVRIERTVEEIAALWIEPVKHTFYLPVKNAPPAKITGGTPGKNYRGFDDDPRQKLPGVPPAKITGGPMVTPGKNYRGCDGYPRQNLPPEVEERKKERKIGGEDAPSEAMFESVVKHEPSPPKGRLAPEENLAQCWQTEKGRMAANLNTYEATAQRQIWLTPTGCLETAGEFRSELERTYPLVDLVSGLSAAAPNAAREPTALAMMQQVRRQFGYMQQDAKRRAEATHARTGMKPQAASSDEPQFRGVSKSIVLKYIARYLDGKMKWTGNIENTFGPAPGDAGCRIPSEWVEEAVRLTSSPP